MRRWVMAVLVALTLGEALRVSTALAAGACEKACDDDDRDGSCPPECASCSCTSLSRGFVPRPERLGAACVMGRIAVAPVETPCSPDPDDILHVPI